MGGILMAASGSADGITVTLNPPNTSRSAFTGGAAGVMDAIVAGSVGALTYAWTVSVPDPTYTLTITGAATSHASFDFGAVGDGETATATVRCTASDGSIAYAEGTVRFANRNPAP